MEPDLHPSIARLPMPARVARLRRDRRGYPVPWFVADIDGEPDFRVVKPDALEHATGMRVCWICGQRLGANVTYVIGPMCAVNRTSSEPPSHHDCATYAARACPFLARPHARRREHGLPDARVRPAGVMLARNPGVTLLWTTRKVTSFTVPARFQPEVAAGLLFNIGDPARVEWYAQGRAATREEVDESISEGLPALLEMADRDGPQAKRELARSVDAAYLLLPDPDPVPA